MTDLTDYSENILIDALFRNSTISRPANWYIGLSSTTPTDAGGNITEPANGYARQPVATGASSAWADPSGGSSTNNTNEIAFPTATGSWGTLTHVVISDAVTAGNWWFWKALDASVAITTDEVFRFQAAALVIAFD
jgi:hypothetical protein